ncbi:amidase signature domain-containing protein [Ilyonectria robusta]|uniref:amidase signature domain-containing protein n=1 Tax=Ilyonectria robusta TaxID=1079257 RepID=UPI001E8EE477|nr:amidase signature domain-containing protein [Ilyonectria robusta]KAH8734769.1 amidase signature domain-containing protein [Ilyonectria robusta]
MAPPTAFADYPEPNEGPDTKYNPKIDQNPVLRGLPLVIGANLISRVGFLQQHFWDNARFGTIKDIPELDGIPYRFHPTVTPLGPTSPMLEFDSELLQAKHTESKTPYYTANDYHEMYKSGKVTPFQVAEALLPLITRSGEPAGTYQNAWVDSHGKDHLVLEAAKASTERWAAGKPLGILDGVPIGVKDDTAVKGYSNHNGMKYNPSVPFFKVQEESVWPVKKLQEAGAIVVGRNAMHELGSDTSGCNAVQGTPTNFNNKAYYPGGSSSGAASCLSVGVVPICVGSDAGGSARVPAAFNGVYGLKTTHHRTMFMNNTMCVTSPLAATVADLTIAYRIMSQPNPECPVQSRFALSIPPEPSAKKVMGIYRDWWNQADPRITEVCEKAVDYFANKCGYDIVDISIPYIQETQLAHSAICVTEMAEAARQRTPDWLSLVGSANKVIMSVATKTPAADFLQYNALRELIMRHLAFLFQKHPGLLIMTPTSPMPGWPIVPGDEKYGMSDTNKTVRNMLYVFMANVTGTPALSAPVGYIDPVQGEGKLPVGLMATGEWGSEEQLLGWAREAEEYLHGGIEGGRRRPSDWLDVMGTVQKKTKSAEA